MHVCMNRGIEDRIMEAYNEGYQDGEKQVRQDLQDLKDMSYEQGYQTGVNDAQQGLTEVQDEPQFEWLEDHVPPFTVIKQV